MNTTTTGCLCNPTLQTQEDAPPYAQRPNTIRETCRVRRAKRRTGSRRKTWRSGTSATSALTAQSLAGTSVTTKLETLRTIVRDHQYAEVDGSRVDAFTANAILNLYDALNDANKTKLLSLDVTQMADVTWTMLK